MSVSLTRRRVSGHHAFRVIRRAPKGDHVIRVTTGQPVQGHAAREMWRRRACDEEGGELALSKQMDRVEDGVPDGAARIRNVVVAYDGSAAASPRPRSPAPTRPPAP